MISSDRFQAKVIKRPLPSENPQTNGAKRRLPRGNIKRAVHDRRSQAKFWKDLLQAKALRRKFSKRHFARESYQEQAPQSRTPKLEFASERVEAKQKPSHRSQATFPEWRIPGESVQAKNPKRQLSNKDYQVKAQRESFWFKVVNTKFKINRVHVKESELNWSIPRQNSHWRPPR